MDRDAKSTSKTSSKKPNILLLFADDMGYGELGVYGQKVIKTPVLDSLAAQGLLFTQFYAGNTVCAPSRASLLTGRHPGNVSIRGNSGYYGGGIWDRVPLKKDETIISEMLQSVGYQTAFIGKWHLDYPDDLSTWAYGRGFDFAIQDQWASPYGEMQFSGLVHYINDMRDSITYVLEEHDFIDHFRTNLALDYLEGKDDSKPFFLFMSYRIPHAHEWQIGDTDLYLDQGWPEHERIHAARITLLDREIGRMVNHLKEMDELDNTIIIFTSDNGGHHEGGHDHAFFQSNGILRGHKRDLYEGGIRVPMIVYWKDHVEPRRVSDHIGAFWDFMPTFAELVGVDSPETDGISFMPEIFGQEQKQHEYLYWEFQLDGAWRPVHEMDGGFRQAIRKGDWKAVRYGVNNETELYNLTMDPSEANNLATHYPNIIAEMSRLFEESHKENRLFPYGGVHEPASP